jgi:hypothetical protein
MTRIIRITADFLILGFPKCIVFTIVFNHEGHEEHEEEIIVYLNT